MIVFQRRVDEKLGRRADERMVSVAQRPPLRQRNNRVAVIGAEPIYHDIVVAGKAGRRGRGYDYAAVVAVRAVNNIVEETVIAAVVPGDVDGPAALVGHDDTVVVQLVIMGTDRTVFLEKSNAAGVIVVKQIIAQQCIDDAVHVDGCPAGATVVVDDIIFHQSVGDDPVAPCAQITVDVQTASGIEF